MYDDNISYIERIESFWKRLQVTRFLLWGVYRSSVVQEASVGNNAAESEHNVEYCDERPCWTSILYRVSVIISCCNRPSASVCKHHVLFLLLFIWCLLHLLSEIHHSSDYSSAPEWLSISYFRQGQYMIPPNASVNSCAPSSLLSSVVFPVSPNITMWWSFWEAPTRRSTSWTDVLDEPQIVDRKLMFGLGELRMLMRGQTSYLVSRSVFVLSFWMVPQQQAIPSAPLVTCWPVCSYNACFFDWFRCFLHGPCRELSLRRCYATPQANLSLV